MSKLLTSFIGNDGGALGGLQLPFKPFTLDEVQSITGVNPGVLDKWLPRFVHRRGSGATGLDWMQAFAVFVGVKFLEEGAPTGRAEATLDYVAMLNLGHINAEFREGRTFPVPANMTDPSMAAGLGCLVDPSAFTGTAARMGNKLNLRVLIEEFESNIARAFPKG